MKRLHAFSLFLVLCLFLLPSAFSENEEITAGEKSDEAMWPVVLMYHCILDEPNSEYAELYVRPSDFEAQVVALKEAGYHFLFADEFSPVDEKSVIITFDDGYRDNYTNAYPILERNEAKGTIFMISSSVNLTNNVLTLEQIQEMSSSNCIRFGSHTVGHEDMAKMTDEKPIRVQLENSKI